MPDFDQRDADYLDLLAQQECEAQEWEEVGRAEFEAKILMRALDALEEMEREQE
jgi:hypothetical protein